MSSTSRIKKNNIRQNGAGMTSNNIMTEMNRYPQTAAANKENTDGMKFLIKLFMDDKVGLKDDLNYDINTKDSGKDSILQNQQSKFKNSVENRLLSDKLLLSSQNNHFDKNKVSKSVRANAERVKNYLDYFYVILERNVAIAKEENLTNSNIEPVYNPLQIIRNRKIRKKYDEPPPRALFIARSPIIAIKQFSSKPNRKFPWYVDMSERASDISWRTGHWHELIGPDGEPLLKVPKHHHKHKLTKHIRSKPSNISPIATPPSLFPNDSHGNNSKIVGEESSPHHFGNNLSPYAYIEDVNSNISEDIDNENPLLETGRVKKFEKILEKSKKWSKPPTFRKKSYNSIETFSPSKNFVQNASSTSLHSVSLEDSEPLSQLNGSIEKSPEKRVSILQDIPIKTLKQKNSLDISKGNTPLSDYSEHYEELLISDVSNDQKGSLSNAESNNTHEELVLDKELQRHLKDIRYINATIDIMQNRIYTHKKFKRKQLTARNNATNFHDIEELLKSTTETLNSYNEKLDHVLKEGSDWNSRWINDYSIRVETLISSTDRIMTDVNTTLTLKLKLFQESAEKHESLKNLRSRKFTKIGYKLLEFLIVLLLWTIWLCVVIFQNVKYICLLFLRAIGWLLW